MQHKNSARYVLFIFSVFISWKIEAGNSTDPLTEDPQKQERHSHHVIQQGEKIVLSGIQPPTRDSLAQLQGQHQHQHQHQHQRQHPLVQKFRLPSVHIDPEQANRLLSLGYIPSIVQLLPGAVRDRIRQMALQAIVQLVPDEAKDRVKEVVLQSLFQLSPDEARHVIHQIIFCDPQRVVLCALDADNQFYLFQALVGRASYNPANYFQERNDFLDIEVDASNKLRDSRLGIPISSDVLGEIDPLWIRGVRFPIQLARAIINKGLVHLFLKGVFLQNSLEFTEPLCHAFREALLDRGSYNTAEGVMRLDVGEGDWIYDAITREVLHSDFLAGLSPDRLQQMPPERARRMSAGRFSRLFSSGQWMAISTAAGFQPPVLVVQPNGERNQLQLPIRGNSQQGRLPYEDPNTEEQKRKTPHSTERKAETHRQKNTPNRTTGIIVHYRDTTQRQGEQGRTTVHHPVVHLSAQHVRQHLRQVIQNQRKKDQPKAGYEDLFRKGSFGGKGGKK